MHMPDIDKRALIGTCRRLPISVDAERANEEIADLSDDLWGSAGRVAAQRFTEAIYLRGYAPAEGERPIGDRPVLSHLPYCRKLVKETIPGPAMRCLIARLPPGKLIPEHTDNGAYFRKTVRIHMPLVTNDKVIFKCGDMFFKLEPNEVWVLNNCTRHAVWNRHANQTRTHLICDFLLTDDLMALLNAGEPELGVSDSALDQELRSQMRAIEE